MSPTFWDFWFFLDICHKLLILILLFLVLRFSKLRLSANLFSFYVSRWSQPLRVTSIHLRRFKDALVSMNDVTLSQEKNMCTQMQTQSGCKSVWVKKSWLLNFQGFVKVLMILETLLLMCWESETLKKFDQLINY